MTHMIEDHNHMSYLLSLSLDLHLSTLLKLEPRKFRQQLNKGQLIKKLIKKLNKGQLIKELNRQLNKGQSWQNIKLHTDAANGFIGGFSTKNPFG